MKKFVLIASLITASVPANAQQPPQVSLEQILSDFQRQVVITAQIAHERDQLRQQVQQLQAELAKLKTSEKPKQEPGKNK